MFITERRLFKDTIEILEEDKEWWLKRRPRDKKNLRVLLGKSAKGGKYTKKGAPFTNDPPKYKGNKGAPGLGMLQERFSINTLKSLKVGESLSITPKKDISGMMKKGTTYFITKSNEDTFSINPPVMGKKVVSLSDLESIANSINPNDFVVNKGKSKKATMKTEISPNQQEDVAKKLTKKHIPGVSGSFISKVGDWFKNSAFIKTIGDVINWFRKLWKKYTGGKEEKEVEKQELAAGVTVTDGKGKTRIGKVEGKRAVFLPNETRLGGTRAWRNNNPGNLRLTTAWESYGAIGREKAGRGGFAIFPDEATGTRALETYIKRFGINKGKTIAKFMRMYAPKQDKNDPASYAAKIARKLNVDVDTPMNTLPISSVAIFAKAIRGVEGWRAGSIAQPYDFTTAVA